MSDRIEKAARSMGVTEAEAKAALDGVTELTRTELACRIIDEMIEDANTLRKLIRGL